MNRQVETRMGVATGQATRRGLARSLLRWAAEPYPSDRARQLLETELRTDDDRQLQHVIDAEGVLGQPAIVGLGLELVDSHDAGFLRSNHFAGGVGHRGVFVFLDDRAELGMAKLAHYPSSISVGIVTCCHLSW